VGLSARSLTDCAHRTCVCRSLVRSLSVRRCCFYYWAFLVEARTHRALSSPGRLRPALPFLSHDVMQRDAGGVNRRRRMAACHPATLPPCQPANLPTCQPANLPVEPSRRPRAARDGMPWSVAVFGCGDLLATAHWPTLCHTYKAGTGGNARSSCQSRLCVAHDMSVDS